MDIAIRLPTARNPTTHASPSKAVQIKSDTIKIDCDTGSSFISNTPPNEFLAILKKRMDVYYSNSSTCNRNN